MNRKNEINAVKQLGEQIGYGNLMDIASALWALKLKKNYPSDDAISSGAFISVTLEMILAKHRLKMIDQQAIRMQEITNKI